MNLQNLARSHNQRRVGMLRSRNALFMNAPRACLRRARYYMQVAMGRAVYIPIDVRMPLKRYGTEYGGWTLANEALRQDSVIYSFGIGEDVSFDLSLIADRGVRIHAFDPTPASLSWLKQQSLPDGLKVHPIALSNHDGCSLFYAPATKGHVSHSFLADPNGPQEGFPVQVRRLQTIMNELGHNKIDVLKLDIEGAEYDVIRDILSGNIPVTQLLVEFHHGMRGISIGETKKTVLALRRAGYRVAFRTDTGREVTFVLPALATPRISDHSPG